MFIAIGAGLSVHSFACVHAEWSRDIVGSYMNEDTCAKVPGLHDGCNG